MLALMLARDKRRAFFRCAICEGDGGPADSDGLTRSHAALDQATALRQGLTDEARQLHDSK